MGYYEGLKGERCDAEIGSAKRGWHACRAKAIVEVTRHCYGDPAHSFTLNFCERHCRRVELDAVGRDLYWNGPLKDLRERA